MKSSLLVPIFARKKLRFFLFIFFRKKWQRLAHNAFEKANIMVNINNFVKWGPGPVLQIRRGKRDNLGIIFS